MMQDYENKGKDEIYSRAIRAGKRTYFFDVKETKNGDYYLTVTESKKVFDRDGNSHFEKHKIFLYREDFEKFMEALRESVDFIFQNKPFTEEKKYEADATGNEFSDVDFDDLADEKSS
ncbi:MAG TPA: DUF3276 family protein [Prolixibacteraceae bacterium]|jgi:glycogen synthase|nr:DUF3276 family protein [Prolixibacteraceae bacterium]